MVKYKHRIADRILERKVLGKGAVLIEGPKWCGKTTTAKQLSKSILDLGDSSVLMQSSQLIEISPKATLENPGQKLIDTSGEPVYFPYLDRQVENMQEEIAKKYYSQLSISPYTTNWGGLDQIFSPLANAFCIAEMHGSIVQTEITRDRLISIYSMLCILYEDHELLVEYIK